MGLLERGFLELYGTLVVAHLPNMIVAPAQRHSPYVATNFAGVVEVLRLKRPPMR